MKLELKKGVEILADVGGITSVDEAKDLIESKCDDANKTKLATINNEDAIIKIGNAASMMQPDSIWFNSGSDEDLAYARYKAKDNNEEFELALPDHTCHYDLPEDQARLVKQTYYIVNEEEDISVLAKRQLRSEALEYVRENMSAIMKGKQMTVSIWNRGPVGAKAAIPAIMITDSFYVVHSGNILYPSAFKHFDEESARAGLFFTNCHSYGRFKSEDVPKARIYMDRSWQTTFSMYCTYAGNTLLLKKGNHRFTVDHCTYERVESELSEHMFITGMTGPGDRKTFIAGAAPSGCGKTTTAMVGTDFIGDDLAQMWIESDGTVRGVNPEVGIFGIVRDVNREGDPYLMKALRGDIPAEVIFSNVLVTEDGTPRWEGDGDPEPTKGKHYTGTWETGKKDAGGNPVPFSNKNARCTLSCTDIENYNNELGVDPAGAPIKIITYSGRDSDTNPPVWVAQNPDQGVIIGASILSAATATEVGAIGVSRQPWANAPFVPGPLADYMDAQFRFFNSDKIKEKPIMAGLNYFLTLGARGGDPADTSLIGEKRDVKAWLTWLELRSHGDVKAINTPIGYLPLYDDLKKTFTDTIGKDYTEELYKKHFSLYVDNIIARIELQEEAYGKEKDCPQRIFEVYEEQKKALQQLKDTYGAIVAPDQLIEAGGVE
ncbi:MAG: phosphoenolpyruvate carboxykinase (GTP) [Chitinivibrionales bacterium]|nr:phosphoenolpyruvate carboxykinase (GTP) [Chitinivibrionales bacterium]